ncbi:hypothetical protein [Streptomyces sp. NRRL S-87]|uniref:hypothetical protein n=1 Tax=Streptomyces sp. NRRL S-87 TaxID=1463920 RepID=UPI0004C0152E|nr:hypothetical protein [Streptomyces sp. NRRL S-87]
MSQHLDHVTPSRIWQPTPQTPAAELELYAVPVPAAVPVVLPDGRTAWAREIAPRLETVPTTPATAPTPMPGWAKGLALASAALSTLTLSGGLAMRIAAPALAPAVELLDTIWKVALVSAVLLLGTGAIMRGKLAAKTTTVPRQAAQPVEVHVGGIHAGGGGRWLSRGGDVNVRLDIGGER